jgi:iron complex outermembrane receptor protein
MTMTSRGRVRAIRGARCALSLLAFSVTQAFADPATAAADAHTLDTVDVSAASLSPAAATSPTQTSLQARAPQTAITPLYIENFVDPIADYGTIVRIAPSYVSSSPNGLGLSEAKDQSLRGFPDGQYNVTYDGIPFGDTNDFTHHTTSYFPAATIGSALVDRSPGDATGIGYATFGGSINLYSPNVA